MVRLCRNVRWVFISLILFTASFLSSCAHSTTKQASAEVKAACQSNALLKRYQCSLKNVAQAATAGDPDAQYALAYMYYYGIDTNENVTESTLWMRRAAALGQPQAIQALQLLQLSPADEQPKAAAAGVASLQTNTKVTTVKTQKQSTQASTIQNKPVQRKSTQTANSITPQAVSPTSYSIQLAASVNLPRLKEYVTTHHLKGKAGYYKACINNTAWYILIYGHYPNRVQATQALQALPASLKQQKPWLKSYKTIQTQIEAGKNC